MGLGSAPPGAVRAAPEFSTLSATAFKKQAMRPCHGAAIRPQKKLDRKGSRNVILSTFYKFRYSFGAT